MDDINVIQLKEKMDNGDDFYFIDVREVYEYEADNLNAVNIPLGEIPSKIEDLRELNASEIIIHCRSGARSGTAKKFLEQAGFKNVRNVLGGILDWNEKILKK